MYSNLPTPLRHPRKGGDPSHLSAWNRFVFFCNNLSPCCKVTWVPASAGMTDQSKCALGIVSRAGHRPRLLGLVPPQLVEHPLERLDVAELSVDVEQVPFDGPRNAVADALSHHDRPEAL
jgi:hypothetical protein